MSDIKEVLANRQGWRHLFDQSFQFFRFLRSEQGLRQGKDSVPSFTVPPETSLLSVMKKMAAVHAHQVWVVNSQHELIGVVSIKDVMPYLLK
jgi:CBS domain containing-hemolysin-like protein